LDLERFDVISAALDAAAGPGADSGAVTLAGPTLARGEFELAAPTDLFLDTSRWGKGVAWVNGFNLGRYWSRGPQRTLYVPRTVVYPGTNTVTILELEAARSTVISFVAQPSLGHREE
jgi:beta-galactosidase